MYNVAIVGSTGNVGRKFLELFNYSISKYIFY